MNQTHYQPRGRHFEDFAVGDSMVTPGRTVTETDIVQFCGLSGDYNELHSNAEYAKQSPFGQRIAHGPLGLIIAVGLAGRLGFLEGTAQAFLGLECKFKRPIFIGDTVHLKTTVAKKREMKSLGGGILVIAFELCNQRDEVVQEGNWNLLLKGRTEAERKTA